jgi:hypothetical protein
MTDDLDEAARERARQFDDLMRRNPECPSAPEREESLSRFHDPDRFRRWAAQRAEAEAKEKADAAKAQKPKPKPEPATDWLDDRMAAFVDASVGPAIEELSNMVAAELDKEGAARAKLEDRVRELMLEQAKALTTIGKLEVAIAHLELRLANGGDRRGGSVIDASPSLKTIN